MSQLAWTAVRHPFFPWCRTLDRIMNGVNVSPLDGPMVFIASDYGGLHKESRYRVVSVLYIDAEASREWELRRRKVRRRFMADGRRMSFKCLGDRQRQKAIIPFLQATDGLTGVCVSLVISKSLGPLHGGRDLFDRLRKALPLQGIRHYRQFERTMCVAHLVAFLIGGLSRPGQHIYWISDQDEIFADKRISADSAQIVSGLTSHYVRHSLGEVGVGTTALDEGDRCEEDLAAIPDLVAGTMAELATRLSKMHGGSIPCDGAMLYDEAVASKVCLLSDWIYDNAGTLKKVAVLFEKQSDGAVRVSRLDMHRTP